jgi:hypothetical protein
MESSSSNLTRGPERAAWQLGHGCAATLCQGHCENFIRSASESEKPDLPAGLPHRCVFADAAKTAA